MTQGKANFLVARVNDMIMALLGALAGLVDGAVLCFPFGLLLGPN